MKLCSIFNCFFSFSGWREEQRFVLNRVGADLQVFISGSNNIGVADIKDIMATGKRSQVARLVCESLLVILSLVTYRILEKDLVLELEGYEVIYTVHLTGLWLRFHAGGYEIIWWALLACENSCFFLLLAAFDILKRGTSGTQQQKYHTDDVNQCLW